MLKQKTFLSIIIFLPSIVFNYFTLSLIDFDHNLSFFTTISIIFINFLNFIVVLFFYFFGLKKTIFLSANFLILFVLSDYLVLKIVNLKAIQVHDKKLGWILNKNINTTLKQFTEKGLPYDVNYKTSKIKGFREYDDNKIYEKSIFVIGDSYTAGPFASNEKMYYNVAKNVLKKKNVFFNWYVAGGGGYGTLQELIILKDNIKLIKPSILIHQFCENDFENNYFELESQSILKNQYLIRPFLKDNKIQFPKNKKARLFRFLYKNSFFFKKVDQILTNQKFMKYNNYYKVKPNDSFLDKAGIVTEKLIIEIRNNIGKDTKYISTNCSTENKKKLLMWKNYIEKANGLSFISPIEKVEIAQKNGLDVFHEDGKHLNEMGNKIYGEELGKKLLEILN